MYLRVFGDLRFQGPQLQEKLPLLVLAYLVAEGPTERARLATLLWPQYPPEKARKHLTEVLLRLGQAAKGSINQDGNLLSTPVTSDVAKFRETADIQEALQLYQGPFLAGIETNKRLKLGDDLTEWLFNTRERLHSRAVTLMLRRAETLGFEENFNEAAELAWRAYTLSPTIAYPLAETYTRLHTLLLAGDQLTDASSVQHEATELYGPDLPWSRAPHIARQQLRHLHSFRMRSSQPLGRETEQGEVAARLREPTCRLLTITGMAGVGKTLLAEAVAQGVRGSPFCRDGTFIAYLEHVASEATEADLAKQILMAIGLSVPTSYQLEALCEYLGDRHVLLTLDNLEHIKGAASIVGTLVQTCPNLTVLGTSRHSLRLELERVFSLGGLASPPEQGTAPDASFARYPAVALFVQAARLQNPDFELSKTTAPTLVRILQRLGGLPLAINLAASWTHLLSLDDIDQALESDLGFLTLGARDSPRQESLTAALKHSLELLTAAEKRALFDLTVFRGTWTLQAARLVAKVEAVLLRSLVDKSLVFFGLNRRFGFHPLIGVWLREQDSNSAQRPQGEHARYYLELLKSSDAAAQRQDAPDSRGLEGDFDNLAAAWTYALEHHLEALLFNACRALQYLGDATGRHEQVASLLRRALAEAQTKRLRAAVSVNLAFLCYRLGEHLEALALIDNCRNVLPDAELGRDRAESISRLCDTTHLACLSSLGRFEEALASSRALLERTGPSRKSHAFMRSLVNDAILRRSAHGAEVSLELREAKAFFSQHGTKDDLAWTVLHEAESLILVQGGEAARSCLEQALQLAVESGSAHWQAMCRLKQTELALELGNLREAQRLLDDMARGLRTAAPFYQARYWLMKSRLYTLGPERDLQAALLCLDEAQKSAVRTHEVTLQLAVAVHRLELVYARHDVSRAKRMLATLEPRLLNMQFRERQMIMALKKALA